MGRIVVVAESEEAGGTALDHLLPPGTWGANRLTVIWTVWAIVNQQLENNVIQPRIQNRALGVRPLGVAAVLFGGTLFGVPGRCSPSPSPPHCRSWSATCGRGAAARGT